MIKKRYTLALLLSFLLITVKGFAYDFQSGGIYYFLSNNRVAVTHGDTEYSGKISIPQQVEYNGKTYSVTSIGDGAFYDCTGLTSILIPSSVTSIGESAFEHCIGLTYITIPSSVTIIGNSAFYNCRGLTSILIPNSVTSIGNSAFYNCSGLTSITIPNSVTYIGNSAFQNCSGLTSVTIPNSVTSIGNSVFSHCSNLTSITIPYSVTSISGYAFSGCSGLTSIVSEIKEPFVIYEGVFSSNTYSTATLTVPAGTKSKYQNTDGWKNFTNIVEAEGGNTSSTKRTIKVATAGTLPDKISESEKYTIEELKLTGELNGTDFRLLRDMAGNNYLGENTQGKLKVLDLSEAKIVAGGDKYLDTNSIKGNGVTANSSFHYQITQDNEIPMFVFYGCYLKNITIPSSVTSIGESAFEHCSGLTPITIPSSVMSIGKSAFSGCSGLTSITIPNSVTCIGERAFSFCSGLTSITIPSSVMSIGNRIFANCSNLTYIKVESGNTKYDSRDGCNAIIETTSNTILIGCKNTTIPNSVTSIGDGTFSGCLGLTSISIPNSVTSIGDYAFYDCLGLTSISIPNSVTSIGSQAFIYCSGLTSITIPSSVTSIGDYAFFCCSGLTSISIPNSVTNIGNSAFRYCSGLTSVISELKDPFEISNSVFSSDTYSNATLTVPAGTKSKYQSTNGWKDFKNIVEAEEGNTSSTKRTIHVATAGTLPNLISDSEKYTIKELTLTGELNGTDFRLLRDMAGNNYLGENTQGKLKVLDLSGAKIVTGGGKYLDTNSIEGGYGGATGSFHCQITQANEIPMYVFCCCYLTNIKLPSSVSSIGQGAFELCISLTSITISSSVTSIGSFAFWGCIGLTSITIPSSVTSIDDEAFFGCSGLTSITIPSSVTSIGRYAFADCSGLTSITIPSSVTSIGSNAFSGCSGLTSVTSEIKDPFVIDENVFYSDTYSNATLTVPAGTKSKYQNTNGWKNFMSIVEAGGANEKVAEAVDLGLSVKWASWNIGASKPEEYGSYFSWGETSPKSDYSWSTYKYGNPPSKYNSTDNKKTLDPSDDAAVVLWGEKWRMPTNDEEKELYEKCKWTYTKRNGINGYQVTGPNGNSIFLPAAGLYDGNNTLSRTNSIGWYWSSSSYDNLYALGFYLTSSSVYYTNMGHDKCDGHVIRPVYEESSPTQSKVDFASNSISYKGTPSTLNAEIQSIDNNLMNVEIPSSVTYDGKKYQVTSIADGVLSNRTFNYVSLPSTITSISSTTFSNSTLGALIWNANTSLPSSVFSNMAMSTQSNFLLYVNSKLYAPSNVSNVVVGNSANSITLSDATNTRFCCPKEFTAQDITYTHHYSMETGGNGKGWETIALPFDVKRIEHKSKGVLTPFASYYDENTQRPFWLYEFGNSGFKRTDAIKANTPYIIAMPNSSNYDDYYNVAGEVTFSATNAKVPVSSSTVTATSGDRYFVPAFAVKDQSSTVYALNVSNDRVFYSGSYDKGSRFIPNLRPVYPFEAYMTTSSSSYAKPFIEIEFEDGTTGIDIIPMTGNKEGNVKVYSLNGQLLLDSKNCNLEEQLKHLPSGIYVVNGKKIIK